MHLKIYSPEKVLFDDKIISVKFPGINGFFQVLKNHAPLISALREGNIEIQGEKKKSNIRISGGFIEVLNNELSALVEE